MRRVLETPHAISWTWHHNIWYAAYLAAYDTPDLDEHDSCNVEFDAQHVAVALAKLGWCLRDAAYCAACEARGYNAGHKAAYDRFDGGFST